MFGWALGLSILLVLVSLSLIQANATKIRCRATHRTARCATSAQTASHVSDREGRRLQRVLVTLVLPLNLLHLWPNELHDCRGTSAGSRRTQAPLQAEPSTSKPCRTGSGPSTLRPFSLSNKSESDSVESVLQDFLLP